MLNCNDEVALADCPAMDIQTEFDLEREAQKAQPRPEPQPNHTRKILKRIVELDKKKKANKKESNEINEELSRLKEECKDLFIELGVDSMRTQDRTIYLNKQIYAGAADGVGKLDVVEELKRLDLSGHISFNTQSLSGYTRERAQEVPEFVNDKGDIIADVEQILAILPGRLKDLLKISEVIDIKVRK